MTPGLLRFRNRGGNAAPTLKMLTGKGMHMKTLMFIAGLALAGTAAAQTPPEQTTREISQLFNALKASDCAFYRNGSWHDAGKAASHLQRKYDYLLRKRLVTSTESFIEYAATRSSVSGKAYQVRCGKQAPVPSKSWFLSRLREIRQ